MWGNVDGLAGITVHVGAGHGWLILSGSSSRRMHARMMGSPIWGMSWFPFASTILRTISSFADLSSVAVRA